MSQNNNPKKYVTMASGWLKDGKKGQYISASVNNKMKMTVELENGQQVPVTNFAVFFAEEKSSAKAPDVRIVFTTEE
jgi:hypothetical protein